MSAQYFEEMEIVAAKAGELNDRVARIENELCAQTKVIDSAAAALAASVKGLEALASVSLDARIAKLEQAVAELKNANVTK